MKPLHQTERRGDTRRPSEGPVRLRQPGVLETTFTGHLVDTSSTGFRIRHGRLTLASGEIVDFEMAGHGGQARAMWTRIVGDQAETGFHILSSKSQ